MIFGFNNRHQQQDTVYHVQSEAAKASASCRLRYSSKGAASENDSAICVVTSEGDDGDPHKEKMLREQHRQVLDPFGKGSSTRCRQAGESGNALGSRNWKWSGSTPIQCSGGNLMMHLRVTDGAPPLKGRLTFVSRAPTLSLLCPGSHRCQWQRQMSFQWMRQYSAVSSVLVQASYSGRTATRKFRLRSTGCRSLRLSRFRLPVCCLLMGLRELVAHDLTITERIVPGCSGEPARARRAVGMKSDRVALNST